jgi:hypothetical protein
MNKFAAFVVLCTALGLGESHGEETEKANRFNFVFSGEIPTSARPTYGTGSSKIHVLNKSKDYVGLGFINAEGNLSTGYSDGNKGQTDFFIGPGSRTHKEWPFVVANGSCFVLYSLKGRILGYGMAKETGEYEVVVK